MTKLNKLERLVNKLENTSQGIIDDINNLHSETKELLVDLIINNDKEGIKDTLD